MKPIFVDIETSGISKTRSGIWQIGAIDLSNIDHYFLGECRVDYVDVIEDQALKVTGKTEEELRDPNKISQKELLINLFSWVNSTQDGVKMKNLASQNPNFDFGLIDMKSEKYEIVKPFHYRCFDLHSVAQTVHYSTKGFFLMEEGKDYSGMNLSSILKFCGIEDRRKDHNALEDCRLGGECFSRLLDGKSLFDEYNEFKVPEYLNR